MTYKFFVVLFNIIKNIIRKEEGLLKTTSFKGSGSFGILDNLVAPASDLSKASSSTSTSFKNVLNAQTSKNSGNASILGNGSGNTKPNNNIGNMAANKQNATDKTNVNNNNTKDVNVNNQGNQENSESEEVQDSKIVNAKDLDIFEAPIDINLIAIPDIADTDNLNTGILPDQNVLDEDTLTLAMEVLMSAVANITQSITENFNISTDELTDVLNTMDMSQLDLLKPEDLNAVLMKIQGVDDSLALLTDEDFYNNFNAVMEDLKNITQQDSGIENMTIEDLNLVVEQTTQETSKVVAENAPVIDIKVAPEAVTQEDDFDVRKPVVTDEKPDVEVVVDNDQVVQPHDKPENKENHSDNHNSDTHHSEHHSENHVHNAEHNVASFMQQDFTEDMQVGTEQTAYSSSNRSENTQNIMRQILDYMKVQVKPDMSNIEMQLHPESLGTLHVQVASKGGVLTANFVTQDETVKAVIETQLIQLKESFLQQGLKVDAIEVTVQTNQFDQNNSNFGGNGDNSDDRNNKNNRNSNRFSGNATSDDELGGVVASSLDERAAVEMAVNGNTVSYSA